MQLVTEAALLCLQGSGARNNLQQSGIASRLVWGSGWVFPTWARTHALDTGEAVNVLKGAIVTADRILTVSQV